LATVLVLDKDPLQLELTTLLLRRDRHHCLSTTKPDSAIQILESADVDMVILDTSMGQQDGFRVCQELRRIREDLPMLVVSEASDEDQVVRALMVGADDFVSKPYRPRELLARVQAVLRRGGTSLNGRARESTITIGSIALDVHRWQVVVAGRQVHLTPRELALLHVLMSNPNRVLSRTQLSGLAWHDFVGGQKAVDVCIQRIRAKLSRVPGGADFIGSRRGLGYKFETPKADASAPVTQAFAEMALATAQVN
jgi:two-component system response regulator MtrA